MEPTETTLKLVIVEDNAALADIYKTRLELLGYQCFVANDGVQAIVLIEKHRPHLVLLDLMIPRIPGDQVLAVMRASEWGKDTKVLIVSNLNEADAPAGLREQGIEGYAVKANLSNDQLDQLVDRILKPMNQAEDVSLDTNGSPESFEPKEPQTHVDTADAQEASQTSSAPAVQDESTAASPVPVAPEPPVEDGAPEAVTSK